MSDDAPSQMLLAHVEGQPGQGGEVHPAKPGQGPTPQVLSSRQDWGAEGPVSILASQDGHSLGDEPLTKGGMETRG